MLFSCSALFSLFLNAGHDSLDGFIRPMLWKPLAHLILSWPHRELRAQCLEISSTQESAPVRGSRKQRQEGLHGKKYRSSETSPIFHCATACRTLAQLRWTSSSGMCLPSASLQVQESVTSNYAACGTWMCQAYLIWIYCPFWVYAMCNCILYF